MLWLRWPRGGPLFCFFLVLNLCFLWGGTEGSRAEILGGPANQLERAREFCGHAGPYVAIGLRMGEKAIKRLNADKYSGMMIEVDVFRKLPILFSWTACSCQPVAPSETAASTWSHPQGFGLPSPT
jgi:hypothetical protein